MKCNEEVPTRERMPPEEMEQDLDDIFTFNHPQTSENLIKCQTIQKSCRYLAHILATNVPEGKELTICLNNLLAIALWANHGITRRQVVIVPVATEEAAPSIDPPSAST